uniref:Ig-like domain-containing protein n=1 Tax=Anabas testudineus TaxID=64144 RepID=A0AAQ6IPB6_ANATE
MKEGEDTDWEYRCSKDGGEIVWYTLYQRYTLQPLYTGDSGRYQYFGRHRSSNYEKNSNIISLIVSVSVTLQHKWSQIFSGETITLRCEIKDTGDTEWEYEWTTSSSMKPPKHSEYKIIYVLPLDSGDYRCRGRMRSGQQSSTEWSDAVTLRVSDKPKPVLSVTPSWLSPGASVTLKCEVEHPSAGWRFYWYKTVPKLSDRLYRYELLPGSDSGTEEDSYMVHGQTHTAGYVCRAGRGEPVFYTEHSKPTFVWSGDFPPSASLTVSPDRVQHFTSDSVSLSCEGNSTEWRVRRYHDVWFPCEIKGLELS